MRLPDDLSQYKTPTVIIVPTRDKWNDFNLRTKFTYYIMGLLPNQEPISGDICLALSGSKESPVEEITSYLNKTHLIIRSASEIPRFYSMHRNMQGYRNIVRHLNSREATRFLLAMNDLVAYRRARYQPPWYYDAIKSDLFALAFMRDADAFFTFYNAGSILSGLEQESLGGISKRLQLKFQLLTFQNEHKIEFSFNEKGSFPRRIAVVIGKNGAGKSQALSNFARSLLSDDERLRDWDGKRPLIQRLVAVSCPGITHATFPAPDGNARIDYRRIFLGQIRQGKGESGLGEVLAQLARSKETIKDKHRWDIFCEAVSSIVPLSELFVPRQLRNGSKSSALNRTDAPYPLSYLPMGGEESRLIRLNNVDPKADVYRFINGKLLPLSSGQLTFIRFAAQACLHIENGTMLLFDEPETHLHPTLITDFIRLLDKLLEITGSYAVLATHSSYFVREVPQSQVIILREYNGIVDATSPRLKTLGADIGAISFFVFGDELYGRLLIDLVKRLKENPQHATELLKEMENELSSEAFMCLRRVLSSEKDE